MNLDLIWKAVVIVLAGTLLLRIAGRKSISQMTLAQTVIMIGIGSLLIQPIVGENVWVTLAVGAILILTLIVMEYVQIKIDGVESLITGKSKILIKNGKVVEENLKKLRLTVDQLEMNLRQQNVTKISDVKWATLEPNGQIGFELMEEAKPVTKKEFKTLQNDIQQLLQQHNINTMNNPNMLQPQNQENIFQEVDKQSHKDKPPKYLQ